MHPVRFGLKLAPQIHPIDVHRAVWRIGDEGGFDHVWGFDHLLALGGDPTRAVFEGWSMLAAMAEVVRRARIGLMVAGNLYRHPGMHAKIAVTIDHLSGGRLEFGIGAAWNEPEFRMFDQPFPGAADRIRMLDEACAVVKLLWTQERTTFNGRYYRLADAIAEPKPLQRPHPPIWIGGAGPKRTLRVVAKHADVWNLSVAALSGEQWSFDQATALNGVLDEHCRTVGRDPAAIRRSAQLIWRGRDDTLRGIDEAIRTGFTEIVVLLVGDEPRRLADDAAAALPRMRELA